MPNWSSDDDPPAGCTRGEWGPNSCTCASCSDERRASQRRQAESDDYYRRQGVDPHTPVMPIMAAVDDATYMRLQLLAGRRGEDMDVLVGKLLRAAMDNAVKRGLIP